MAKELTKEDKVALGDEHGYLFGQDKHPRCIEVVVRPRRHFQDPEGGRSGPSSTLWVAECQLDPNKSIIMVKGGQEHKDSIQIERKKRTRDEPGTRQRAEA